MTGPQVLPTTSQYDQMEVDRRVGLHYLTGCWCEKAHLETETGLVTPPWALREGAA